MVRSQVSELLRVGVSDWVVGCCLEPPRVGQWVEWQLQFYDQAEPSTDDAAVHQLRATARPLAEWEGQTLDRHPVLLQTPAGASLYWEATGRRAGDQVLTGNISISQHGEAPPELPVVKGLIRRVRLAATLYEEQPTGSRSWVPVHPLDVLYEDVQAAPKWFPHTDSADGPIRVTNSALVDLEVSPAQG